MAEHPFHLAIGSLIVPSAVKPKDFPKSGSLSIFKDRACDSRGHRISLYNRKKKPRVKYCDVDILIATEKEAKVIIEIEESNVKPIQIFGKFFASAFSTCYLDKGRDKARYCPISEKVLFIQVLDSSKLKEESRKPEQWAAIEKQIQASLKSLPHEKWKYRLFKGTKVDFFPKALIGKEFFSTIMSFLEQNP